MSNDTACICNEECITVVCITDLEILENLIWIIFVPYLQMYMGGKLVHADRTFNGYGTTKKDFMKQV